jgi:hypothetical protein
MRVVVDRPGLLVEPGISFRTGGNPTDPYDSSLDPTSGNFAGDNSNDFFDSGSPSTGGADGLGSDIGLNDLPVAFVSNDTNGDISIQVAAPLGTVSTFEDMLQVTNNTGSSVNVGIKFSAFGVDTTTSNLGGSGDFTDNGGAVEVDNVISAYRFVDADNTSNEISSVSTDSPPTLDGQTTGSVLSVGDGNTEQITLEVDMTDSVQASTATDNIVNQVSSAATTNGSNPFQTQVDTVQLINEITVGKGDETSTGN